MKDDKKQNIDETVQTEYWQDVENKVLDPAVLKDEFHEGELQYDVGETTKTRRNFLKIMGFSFTAMPLASCMRIPVKKALPYINKTDKVIPGVANWYATSMDPLLGSSLLVKTREGRPIKIEGNPASPSFKGGTNALDQASVLSLYNSHRYKNPIVNGTETTWSNIDKKVAQAFEKATDKSKEITLVTSTLTSPSTIALIEELKAKYSNFKHVVYEPYAMTSILEANQRTFGSRNYNKYSFDKADVVVSFSADFLGTWLSPVEFTKQYTSRRDLVENKTMLKHIHFESLMSLTGSNADDRFTVTPEEESAFMVNLLAYIQRRVSKNYLPQGQKLPETNRDLVEAIGDSLVTNKGKSLVVSGSKDISHQIIVNTINEALGNYGKTINIYENEFFVGAEDKEFENFIQRAESSKVGIALFLNANPVYNYFDSKRLVKAMKKIETNVSFSYAPDETSALCNIVAPNNYFLESWADYYQTPGLLTFSQPVIQPIYGSRMAQELLLSLVGKKDYYEYIKSNVKKNFFNSQSKYPLFTDFWNNSVHEGVAVLNKTPATSHTFSGNSVALAFSRISKKKATTKIRVQTYKKVGMGTGDMANNPWLQELPDPITKATWDNYFMMSPKLAKDMGLKSNDVISVSSKRTTLELPVLVQPGTSELMLGLAVGYGRTSAGKVGDKVGGNAYRFMNFDKFTYLSGEEVEIKKTSKKRAIAQTQTHHSMEGRDIVRETTLNEWTLNNKAGNKPSIELISLWSKHDKTGHQWAMAIDLNKCTGCSGCVISCHAENNVPVVGRKEVLNRRDMHWMRIDRYYKGDDNNPEVVHQPLMCQHCDNAPCETVCPVLATVQSSDGLNQQVYNRCVGTRYCANNCPYKVRRFNWFDYPHNDKNESMVLNPDVVVRSRGVMEKCSMCIQRIQEGKLEAKKKGVPLKDGDIKIACQQSCPGDAIIFGDINDKNSKLSKLINNQRGYRLLEELNVSPRVNYLVKVRNKG